MVVHFREREIYWEPEQLTVTHCAAGMRSFNVITRDEPLCNQIRKMMRPKTDAEKLFYQAHAQQGMNSIIVGLVVYNILLLVELNPRRPLLNINVITTQQNISHS